MSLEGPTVPSNAQNPPPSSGPAKKFDLTVLSGPEGGLSPVEIALAESLGFVPVSLGTRVLRADTAPLAALAVIAALAAAPPQTAPQAAGSIPLPATAHP